MNLGQRIIQIDPDTARRALLSHSLAGSDYHIEPFEDLSEIARAWPRHGAIFACDEGEIIENLLNYMAEFGDRRTVVAYSPTPRTARIVSAIHAGATDYLEWPISIVEVEQVLSEARTIARPEASARQREWIARRRLEKLTRREREVLACMAEGMSSISIGEKLAISPRTVEIHRSNVKHKIGAKKTSEAIKLAIEASIFA